MYQCTPIHVKRILMFNIDRVIQEEGSYRTSRYDRREQSSNQRRDTAGYIATFIFFIFYLRVLTTLMKYLKSGFSVTLNGFS